MLQLAGRSSCVLSGMSDDPIPSLWKVKSWKWKSKTPSTTTLRSTSHKRVCERGLQVVCVVCGIRGPLYSLWRSVPAIFIYGNMLNCHQEDQNRLPTKMHLDGLQGGSAKPLVRPTPPCRLWPPSLSGTLPGGPWCWYVGTGASLVGLV